MREHLLTTCETLKQKKKQFKQTPTNMVGILAATIKQIYLFLQYMICNRDMKTKK